MKRKTILLLLAWLLGGASLACAQPQPGSPWPMLHHDQYHTGRSAYNGPETPTLKWTFATESTTNAIISSPAIAADGTIYLPARDGYLYAINPDGTEKWRFFLIIGGSWSSPAIGGDGTIYVGGGDYEFVAVNPDGTLRWETDTIMGGTMGPVIGSDGTVYVGDRSAHLFAFNPDGTLQWVADLPYPDACSFISAPSVGPDGTIYIGSDRGFLFAVYPNGSLRWQIGVSGPAPGYPGATSFSVEESTIFTGSATGMDKSDTLYAIAPNSAIKWKFPTGDDITRTPSVGNDGAVYFGTFGWRGDNSFYALYPDGTLKWRFPLAQGVHSAAAIDSDGTVYFATDSYCNACTSYVYALKLDGTFLWRYGLPDRIASSPAIGADGTLYIGCCDGKLYAFGKPTGAEGKLHSRIYRYGLLQNQPNPFQRSTVISYFLPAATHVILQVFGISGRLVENLVDVTQDAGVYQVLWNAEDNSNGVYFYQLRAGGYNCTKKMVVVD